MALSTPTTTGNILSLLREGVIAEVGNYKNYETNSRKILKTMKSHRYQEIIPKFQFTGTANLIGQGQNSNFSTIGQVSVTTATNNTYQVGVELTRQAIDDNLYDNMFPLIRERFTISHITNEEISCMNLINNGFINNPDTNLADGQPWFSTAHPLGPGYGTVSNTVSVGTALNSYNLLLALSTLKYQFKDMAGMNINAEGVYLVVSPDLWPVAVPLLGSKYNPDTASNAINPIFSEIKGLIVSPYINAGTWVITTNQPGLFRFDRDPLEMSVFEDNNAYILRINSYRRFIDCVADWPTAFGARTF